MIRVRFPIIVAVLEILTYSKNKKFSFSNQWKWLYLCSPEHSESFSHENRCNQCFLNKRTYEGRSRKRVCLSIRKYHFLSIPLVTASANEGRKRQSQEDQRVSSYGSCRRRPCRLLVKSGQMLKLVAIFVSRRTYPRWYSNRHLVVLFWNKVLWRLFGDCGWVALSVRERPAPLKYCQLFTKLLGQLVHRTFQNMDFIFWENGISLSIFMGCSMKCSLATLWQYLGCYEPYTT